MIYSDFNGIKISSLGYGCMRFPEIDGMINKEETFKLIDYALENGINYFDTGYSYHSGTSEIVLGEALARHKRDSYFIATKYPGHQLFRNYDPKLFFEEQLKKCGVDFFDFYLLHNICESSWPVYTSEKWGVVDYFAEQKRAGRIKHLGFSCHAEPELLEEILERYGEHLEFCQIQFNYLDYTLQRAKEKYEILQRYNKPIWVMEPLRGGKLARLLPEQENKLKALRPDDSIASWSFRWLQQHSGVKVVLSGMTTMEALQENINTFSTEKPLSDDENALLYEIAESLKSSVPCTKCRYCCAECPKGLNIPMLIQAYNDINVQFSWTPAMMIDTLPDDKRPSACIGCGRCMRACPQKIKIPEVLRKLNEKLKVSPSWMQASREREHIAEEMRTHLE